jgi:hypothetical protein
MAMLSACATSRDLPADYIGTIKTQTGASEVAACVGQSVAVTPVITADGLVVDAPGARPPRRYTIKQTKEETVIVIEGGYAPGLAVSDTAALECTLQARWMRKMLHARILAAALPLLLCACNKTVPDRPKDTTTKDRQQVEEIDLSVWLRVAEAQIAKLERRVF